MNKIARLAAILKDVFGHPQSVKEQLRAARAEITLRDKQIESLNEQLKHAQEEAMRDKMTGAYNKGAGVQKLRELFASTLRKNVEGKAPESLAILMIDIDHFKNVNDTHGHAVGDQAIKDLATVAKTVLKRETDMLVRDGGEEFFIAFVGDSAKMESAALQMAERLRKTVEQTCRVGQENNHQITISVGVAVCEPTSELISQVMLEKLQKVEHTAGAPHLDEDVITTAVNITKNQADQALYHAKQTGRNRVSVYSDNAPKAASEKAIGPARTDKPATARAQRHNAIIA